MTNFITVTIFDDVSFGRGEAKLNVNHIISFKEHKEDLTLYQGDVDTIKAKEYPVWIITDKFGFCFSKLSYKDFSKKMELIEEEELKIIAEKISRFQMMDLDSE